MKIIDLREENYKMASFNFYKADKAYGEVFFQFPKVLFYSKKYSKLSDGAKLAYMIFKDRLQYSLKNNWIDEENNVYFIFTNDELCDLLDKSNKTVVKLKNELVEAGLLLQKQMGFDPVLKKNRANRLYLADLEVNAMDIYQLQKQAETLDTSGSVESTPRQENPEIPSNQGSVESTPRQKGAETLDTSGSVESTLYQYRDSLKAFKDIKDIKESSNYENQRAALKQSVQDSKSDNKLNHDLINQFIEDYDLETLYGEPIVRNFVKYSFGNYDTFKLYVSKLVFAHKAVQKENGRGFGVFMEVDPYFEQHQLDLSRTFYRCVQQERAGKAEEFDNYLFISFKNEFKEIARHITEYQNKQDSDFKVPLYDWVSGEAE